MYGQHRSVGHIMRIGPKARYPNAFLEESEPSFKINLDRKIWYDFGEGEGDAIIDFV